MAWVEAYKVLGYPLAGADHLRHRLKRATNSCAVFHAGGFALADFMWCAIRGHWNNTMMAATAMADATP